MKILITGANGFIGKNLIARLSGEHTIYAFDINNTKDDLQKFTQDCDFVYNFAAVHRPKDVSEFDKVNHVFFDDLLQLLKQQGNACNVLYTSSIQATNGSEYGDSKLAAEKELGRYAEQTGAKAIVYRLTNVFGRWATPNHHSVVATFCYNLVHGQPITVSDPAHKMQFYYIDDVIDSFAAQLDGSVEPDSDGIYRLPESKVYGITLGELADTLTRIKTAVDAAQTFVPASAVEEKLHITYMSYYNEG